MQHLSGSCLNLFDLDIDTRYTKYVLGQEPDYPQVVLKAFEFGKKYEEMIGEVKFKGYEQQVELREIIWGYEMLGYLDFKREYEVIECKTKAGWWSESDVRSSRQFRFYNWRCNKNGLDLILHQYNKKLKADRTQKVNREDPDFEKDLIAKANQISFFLSQYGQKLECCLKKCSEV